ncbi:stage VI sporulation protein D [Desertibacillus haloalkaliphilus]|uniref:stage VI sporulation protein D n=1 Tax=Desertibacillus haloalkaliphilus TaxID=1328930 RepID=UPI001C25224D|nr:stage VI sporulation protein D [Desertibacillus haloalkaliphilus]MBU8905064.1 stage VI sporulation protein D [Desertibacillus haloalkaliphilus]
MPQDHPSKLSFSIEESVWLNKGQEISEIVSMSLEPEIAIEERSDHIVIRGGLQLFGEYRPENDNENPNTESESLQEQVSFRSIEDVTDTADDLGEITHYFPIDVTIPLNRISNLDDIYVQIESFDYDLPERSCIQLTADVTISGMDASDQSSQVPEEAVRAEQHDEVEASEPQLFNQTSQLSEEQLTPQPHPFETFQFEARKTPEEDTTESTIDPGDIQEQGKNIEREPNKPITQPDGADTTNTDYHAKEAIEEPIKESKETTRPDASETENTAEQEPEEIAIEASAEDVEEVRAQTVNEEQLEGEKRDEDEGEQVSEEAEPVADEGRTKINIHAAKEPELDKVEAAETQFSDTGRDDEPVESVESSEEEEKERTKINLAPLKQISEQKPEVETQAVEEPGEAVAEDGIRDEEDIEAEDGTQKSYSSHKEENALYLTKMLTKGMEEQFSKVRMCIIQEGESLDTIAERYEVSTSQLIRANRLDEERVEEGQILYIPVSANSQTS